VVEGDQAWLAAATEHLPELVKGVTEAHDAITTEAFEQAVTRFFASTTHPTRGVPYTQMGYRPMRELIALLQAHQFTVYICSAGGRDFVRPVAEEMYGVPPRARDRLGVHAGVSRRRAVPDQRRRAADR
jgi:phosphoserine phosphatase